MLINNIKFLKKNYPDIYKKLEKIDSKNSRYKDNIDTEEHPFFYVFFNVLIRALETLAALVAILEFTGIQWRRF